MKTFYSTLILILVCFLYHKPALALGKLGHQLVCQLAFDKLSSTTQGKVLQLLASMPPKQKKQINTYNFNKSNSSPSFASACNWPDAIKRDNQYRGFKSWHYVNVKRSETEVSDSAGAKKSCEKGCITSAIHFHQAQLANSPSIKVKREALMFLGHWLGDIHQPMHVSFASDHGGNKSAITVTGLKCTNMHWLWDECLLTSQVDSSKLHAQFQLLLNKLTLKLAGYTPVQLDGWRQSSVTEWANESLAIALDESTHYCQMNTSNQCKAISNNKRQLPDNYSDEQTPVINQRILQASIRLANRIETALR